MNLGYTSKIWQNDTRLQNGDISMFTKLKYDGCLIQYARARSIVDILEQYNRKFHR